MTALRLQHGEGLNGTAALRTSTCQVSGGIGFGMDVQRDQVVGFRRNSKPQT